jgi:hypothetical protein
MMAPGWNDRIIIRQVVKRVVFQGIQVFPGQHLPGITDYWKKGRFLAVEKMIYIEGAI